MDTLNGTPKDLFQALSDSIRLRLIRLLLDTNEDICLCEFVDSLQEPEYKLSRQTKILRQVGLLSAQKIGRWVYHSIVEKPFLKQLYAFIQALPDEDSIFASDLKRFRNRLSLREKGRCLVGIQTPYLANKDEDPAALRTSVVDYCFPDGDGNEQSN